MMHRTRQQGLTLLSVLIVVVAVGIAVLLGIRVMPVYQDAWIVNSILDKAETRPFTSVQDVQRYLQKNLELNNISQLNYSDFSITEGAGRYVISIHSHLSGPITENWFVQYRLNRAVTLEPFSVTGSQGQG